MASRLELTIARRLSFSREQRTFTRGVSIFAGLGMALGVSSLIVVLSVMNGLAGELTGRLLKAVPHLEVGDVIAASSVIETTELDGLTLKYTPYIRRQLMLRGDFLSSGAELTGVGAMTPEDFSMTVLEGDLDNVMSERFQIALGEVLASNLGVGVGDTIDAVLPQVAITPFGLLPRYRELTVGAVVAVGASPDATLALTSLETARKLSRVDRADGIRLQLSDPYRAGELAQLIRSESHGTLIPVTWAETYQSLFAAIRMEKLMVSVLLSALIAVAAFSVISSLTMSVAEKRSDIACLRVLGLTPADIRAVFILHGLSLALLGIAIGLVLGLVVTANLEALMRFLETSFGWTLFDPSVYYIGGLPTDLQWPDVAYIILGALVLSLIAAVYPAHRASKISPVLALDGLEGA
ncbi:MAG: FtsX-like permease family protein [Pseudomonadota bacterium]|nr:FtsX-like permease family protein [Pseudomonadota bacterium]